MPSSEQTPAPRRVQMDGRYGAATVPPGAVYVGRRSPNQSASIWANPHETDSRCERCDLVHRGTSGVHQFARDLWRRTRVASTMRLLREQLGGRDLACWCKPGELCHGDVLLLVAAGLEPQQAWEQALATATLAGTFELIPDGPER